MPPRETRPPVCRDGWCQCACHDWLEGTAAELAHKSDLPRSRVIINGLGASPVRVESVIEAAIACTKCQRFHTIVISGRPCEIDGIPYVWNPPPMNAALPDSDATGQA